MAEAQMHHSEDEILRRVFPILGNYLHRRHYLQTVNLPAFTPSKRRFLYMKNHKCACTTVLATLMTHLQREAGTEHEFDMDTVHTPPKSLLLTGPRGLTLPMVDRAIHDDRVFKFTIVREPVARTVSAFADKIVKGDKQKTKLMNYLGRPKTSDITLSEFLDIMAHDEGARDVDRHWREQRKEVSYDFIPFDFIGDMADLNGAMTFAIQEIFGETPQLQDTRTSLGHKSRSRELIEGMTAQDHKNIETAFGPDFEMYEEVKTRLKEAA